MEGSIHTIKVGLAVVLAIVLMIAGYLALNEIQIKGATYTVHGQFQDALGIKVGQPVLLRGKKIGEVTAFDIVSGDDDFATVDFGIREGVELYSDLTFVISQDGLLGEKYISVAIPEPRDPHREVLAEGDALPGGNQTDINELLSDADMVLEQIGEVLDPQKIDEGLGSLLAQVQETLDNVNTLLGTVNDQLTGSENYIEGTVRNVHAMSVNFLAMSENFNATSEELNALVADPAKREQLEKIMANMEDVSTNLSELTAQINALAGDEQLQSDIKESVTLTKETLAEAKETMVKFQGTLEKADGMLESADSLMSTTEEVVVDTKKDIDKLTNVGDAIEIKLGMNVRAVDADDNHGFSGDDLYVGDMNAAVGYEDTYVYIGADDIGEDTNFNLMMGYGDLAGFSFRGGVYRGELGLGAAYYGPVGAEVMLYDTEDPKLNAYGYIPIMERLNLVLGGEDLGDEAIASIGIGMELD